MVELDMPIPTNSWSENLFLGQSTTGSDNRIFQVPYIFDTGGPITGIRVHTCNLQAADRSVLMTYELDNGLTLGAMEHMNDHVLLPSPTVGRLAVDLQWKSVDNRSFMTMPIVRGAPYATMLYSNSRPRIYADRSLSASPLIDEQPTDTYGNRLICGNTNTTFSNTPVLVKNYLQLQFDTSDFTWLIFVSKPTFFVCSNVEAPPPPENLSPGVVLPQSRKASFDLRVVGDDAPTSLVIRIALANNCSTGQNPIHCNGYHIPRPQPAYTQLLKEHYQAFPTGMY
jgi:hypothetical protein